MKKILILASNPRKDLNLDREIRELKDVIERSRSREEFEVEDALAVRVGDLQELLFQHEPHIVHFCGHGGGRAGLVLEGNDGGEQWVQTEALRGLFRLFSSKVRCVLLNACYSEEQANEIVNHIDHVIGMEQEIRDDAAIAFSKGFYRALGYDCSIEEAYEFGCNAIQLEITNRATVRSGTTELTRKAEVVKAVNTTVIPEHMKPIFKKREGASRSTDWGSHEQQALSQGKKEEIQWELAKAVINTPADRVATPPDRVLPIPVQHSAMAPDYRTAVHQPQRQPQGLLEVPDSRSRTIPQRRIAPVSRHRPIAPLVVVSSILVGLIPVVGIYTWWAKQPAPTNPNPPVVTTQKPPEPLVIPPLQPGQTLLEQAVKYADQEKWKEAIATLKNIPNDSPEFNQGQNYLAEWSIKLLAHAQAAYEEGEIDIALEDVGGIPGNSPNYRDVEKAIAVWQEDQQKMNELTSKYLAVHDMDNARKVLSGIQSPGLLKKAEALIEQTQKIVDRDKLEIVTPPPVSSKPPPDIQYLWLADRPVTATEIESVAALSLDVKQKSLDLDIMRNSLFARHHYRFNGRADLYEKFSAYPWYQPTDISWDDSHKQFSEIELQNYLTICTFQKEKNLTLANPLNCGN
jgi:YARHG domain/CHAT domain